MPLVAYRVWNRGIVSGGSHLQGCRLIFFNIFLDSLLEIKKHYDSNFNFKFFKAPLSRAQTKQEKKRDQKSFVIIK